MSLMECRKIQLDWTLEALKTTDEPLVTLSNQSYGMSGFGDDPGIFYFVPHLANFFGVSIAPAASLFLGSLLALGAAISILCFILMFKDWRSRLISILAIFALTGVAYRVSDVYIVSFFTVTAIAPLFVLITKTHKPFSWIFIPAIAWSGIVIGYGNTIRAHSGTGMFLFLLSWILLNRPLLRKEKILCALMLVVFTSIPLLHFTYLERKRDRFLAIQTESISNCHPIWHPIYLGFGYLKNPYGIAWSDTVGLEKAQSIDPNVISCSQDYEQILKNQCLLLVKTDPLFVIKTVLAKIFAMLAIVALFANVGLLLLFFVKPPLQILLPLSIAAAFYSLAGILIIPLIPYVLGTVSIATLFGIYMICLCLEKKFQIHPNCNGALTF